MALFQRPPLTPEELERNKPLDIPPEEVAKIDEREWYRVAYRGDAAQLTVRAVAMGTVIGFFLAFTNIYVGLKAGWGLGGALTPCLFSFTLWPPFLKPLIPQPPLPILPHICCRP